MKQVGMLADTIGMGQMVWDKWSHAYALQAQEGMQSHKMQIRSLEDTRVQTSRSRGQATHVFCLEIWGETKVADWSMNIMGAQMVQRCDFLTAKHSWCTLTSGTAKTNTSLTHKERERSAENDDPAQGHPSRANIDY